ncbi:MAG TPA: macro domain-containing protein [Gemmatimonadales bacterium]|nr:macro domain-containing protein [Gemmatimonadales bacterium]
MQDLASAAADAVVRPTNGNLDAITPALRRLDLAAGPTFRDLCRVQRELGVGAAVVTPAGDLAAELVVHAVVMTRAEPVTRDGVRRAAEAALRQAEQWHIATLATPPLGTGAGQLSLDDAAATLLAAVWEHGRNAGHPSTVAIVVETDAERDVFEARLARGSPS